MGSKMTIPVGIVGKVIAGNNAGRFVKVVDDESGSGGFLILKCSDRELTIGFDDWVEDKDALVRYFREAKWLIEWFD
jgi:hypothetical protein